MAGKDSIEETISSLKNLGEDALLAWLLLLEQEAENLAVEGLLLMRALQELGHDFGGLQVELVSEERLRRSRNVEHVTPLRTPKRRRRF